MGCRLHRGCLESSRAPILPWRQDSRDPPKKNMGFGNTDRQEKIFVASTQGSSRPKPHVWGWFKAGLHKELHAFLGNKSFAWPG